LCFCCQLGANPWKTVVYEPRRNRSGGMAIVVGGPIFNSPGSGGSAVTVSPKIHLDGAPALDIVVLRRCKRRKPFWSPVFVPTLRTTSRSLEGKTGVARAGASLSFRKSHTPTRRSPSSRAERAGNPQDRHQTVSLHSIQAGDRYVE